MQYEEDTDFKPSRPEQRTAQQRLDEVKQVASSLGFTTLAKPKISDIVTEAGEKAGSGGKATRAMWRLASGFAHGFQWQNLQASGARDARHDGHGYRVGLVAGDELLKKMSDTVLALLTRAENLHHARRVV